MIQQKFDTTIQEYLLKWNQLSIATERPHKGSFIMRYYRYTQIKRQLQRFSKNLPVLDEMNLSNFKDDPELKTLIQTWLQFDVNQMDQSLQGSYVEVTEHFINRVKERWPDMVHTSIFQALRNVWIMIAIQMMAEKTITLTDSMFAYSMLYPLTDNIIDDPMLSQSDKYGFVVRLGQRLNGIKLTANSRHEADVFDMVMLIETQYERTQYPDVYESLLLIHDAQVQSLSQQYGGLSEQEILALSFVKGASSVIADGYLVLGNLEDSFFKFLTGYGIVLQLADDLQDMKSDAELGHKTIFSTAKGEFVREQLTVKLAHLSRIILLDLPCSTPVLRVQMIALLDKSMTFLLDDAIHMHKKLFSKAFYRHINRAHITGLKNHERLKIRCEKIANQLGYQITEL